MRKLMLATRVTPSMEEALSRFWRRCEAKGLAPTTIGYYGFHLRAFERYLQAHASDLAPADVTTDLLRGFLAERMKVSPVTANHSLLTLRVFYRFLVTDGMVDENPTEGLDSIRRKKPIIPTFTNEQITALLATCDGKDFGNVRDLTMILLLLDTGLRATELCGLALDNIAWGEQTLTVWGKGGKQRAVPFGEATRRALRAYLDRRGNLDTDRVFVSCYGESISRRRLLEIVTQRGRQAKVHGVRCSPHTLRHTCAVMFLRNGGDVFSLQKMLGHSDLAMTRRYAELSQTDVIDRHRACSPGDRFLGAVKPAGGRKRLK